MSLTIPVAHDFICPWCWVGLLQSKRLENEFGVNFEWFGFELLPESMEWPDRQPEPDPPANRPPTLSRFQFLLAADDIEMPAVDRPKKMRSFNAHQAVEYAKTEGVANSLVEALYRAYWERGEEINNLDVLRKIAEGIVRDVGAMAQAIESRTFKANIVDYDEPAYAVGIYNVPTFTIAGERYAEQPYSALRKAVASALE